MTLPDDMTDARLALFGSTIDRLATRAGRTSPPATFEEIIEIDELKILYAIVTERRAAYRAAEVAQPELDLNAAWDELVAAMDHATALE